MTRKTKEILGGIVNKVRPFRQADVSQKMNAPCDCVRYRHGQPCGCRFYNVQGY